MRSRIYLIFCSVLFCVLLTSCNLIDELKGSSSVNGASIEEEHAAAKYGAYINLNNMMTGGALDRAIEGYISEFGMDENMYISEDFSGSELASFPGLDGLAKTVNTAVDRAAGEPSYGAADEALIQLGPVILDLLDTMEVITDYYNDGTYADDQFAKGKELHSQFIAQYHTYEPLANQFYNDFDQIAAQQKLSDLDKLKEQDYLIRYHALSVVMRAQDIEKAFLKPKFLMRIFWTATWRNIESCLTCWSRIRSSLRNMRRMPNGGSRNPGRRSRNWTPLCRRSSERQPIF